MGGASPSNALAAAAIVLRGGAVGQAIRLCRQLLAAYPDDAAVHHLAANAAMAGGHFKDAFEHALASLRLRPAHTATLVVAGKAAKACGDLSGAKEYFRRAAEIAPDLSEPTFLLCVAQLEAGDDSAHTSLATLLERFPNDASGWSALGGALEKLGKVEASIAAYLRAAKSAPSAHLHLHLGKMLRSVGRLDGSARELTSAIALLPESAPAWFALGVTEQDSVQYAKAIHAYHRALQLAPEMAEAAVNLGICLQQTGALAQAKCAYGHALHLRADTFGRIAQALTMAPKGELWLDLRALRAALLAAGAGGTEMFAVNPGA